MAIRMPNTDWEFSRTFSPQPETDSFTFTWVNSPVTDWPTAPVVEDVVPEPSVSSSDTFMPARPSYARGIPELSSPLAD